MIDEFYFCINIYYVARDDQLIYADFPDRLTKNNSPNIPSWMVPHGKTVYQHERLGGLSWGEPLHRQVMGVPGQDSLHQDRPGHPL